MLTKTLILHPLKDALNSRGESSTSTTQDYDAGKFIRSAKIMRLRKYSTFSATLNPFFERGQSPFRKSLFGRALFRPSQIA